MFPFALTLLISLGCSGGSTTDPDTGPGADSTLPDSGGRWDVSFFDARASDAVHVADAESVDIESVDADAADADAADAEPSGPIVLARRAHENCEERAPWDLALDGGYVYWTYAGHFDAGTGNWARGAVRRVSTSGGTSELLAEGPFYAEGVAVSGDHVFWTARHDGALMRVPTGGGTVETIATGLGKPSDVAVYDDRVWVVDNSMRGRVLVVPLGGGEPSILADDQEHPGAIAVDATGIYWTNNGTFENGAFTGAVMRAAHDGEPGLLAESSGAYHLTVDGGEVFWTIGAHPTGTVWRIAADGTEPTLVADQQTGPMNVAADDTHVYWTNYDGGTVMRAPRSGGPPEQLADLQPGPGAIAVDETAIYWTLYDARCELDAPTVMMLSRDATR